MTKLTISLRIYLMLFAIGGLFAFAGFVAFDGLQSINDTYRDYRATARSQMLAANIGEDFAQARTAALKYRLNPDPIQAREVVSNIAEIKDMSLTIDSVVIDLESSRNLKDLSAQAVQYGVLFQKAMEPGSNAEEIFREGLDRIGPQVTAKLDEVQNAFEVQQNRLGPEGQALVDELSARIPMLILASMMVAGLLSFFIARGIVGPIRKITADMLHIAETGETGYRVSGLSRQDEIGGMARALGTFQENLAEKAEAEERQRAAEATARKAEIERKSQEAAAEQERLVRDARIEEERKREQTKLRADLSKQFKDEFGTIVESLARSSLEMADVATSMMDVAVNTVRESERASDFASNTARKVGDVSSAAEQISASAEAMTSQVTEADRASSDAADQSRLASTQISSLSSSAGRISEVIDLINDIAEQTNLLALNATIEAARAGDAGKGFAVVASEVKSLAGKTAGATQEIATQVGEVQNAVSTTVDSMASVSQKIEQITQVASSVTEAMDEQKAATGEIASGTNGASDSTQEVAQIIEEVKSAADKSGAKAKVVHAAAKKMTTETSDLLLRVDDFARKIAAA